VVLEAGEALYLPAGNLHAYLRGAGMEIMANSDNVLRGGLTPKHMDVPELLRVLEFSDREVPRVRAQVVSAEATYPTPAEEFQLTRIVLEHASHRPSERRGPEILLCTEGQLELSEDSCTLRLEQGQAVFVGADSGHYSLDGTGTAYRATANLGI
jgi:mannose-6-phosphate isomerase